MKALLIIDMQLGSFRPYTARYDTLGTIERINKLAAQFRDHHCPVIFIQHDGTGENCFIPGTDDWELLPELIRQQDDIVISKTANDAFYNTKLPAVLAQHNINTLFIAGCATDFCVDTTVKAALSKDYQVTIIADGHTTANRLHINAEDVIAHYNWVWGDMSPTKHKLQVIKAADINLGK